MRPTWQEVNQICQPCMCTQAIEALAEIRVEENQQVSECQLGFSADSLAELVGNSERANKIVFVRGCTCIHAGFPVATFLFGLSKYVLCDQQPL